MRRAWIFFWILTLIWGSSFLFMRIGVEELPPAQLTFARTGIAALGMNLVLLFTGRKYPNDKNTLFALAILGLVNTAFPFTLLAWGEQTVESGMTSVLQAITPLFALVIAHFTFVDERITLTKILGIIVSFVGLLVLTSRDWAAGTDIGGDLSGEIAILVASFCYGIGTNFSRKMLKDRGIEPIVVAGVSMTFAAIGSLVMMYTLPIFGERAPVSFLELSGEVQRSALILGVLNTFIAYLMFYYVIAGLGAARASMVTYVVPVVAVTLGAIFLSEVIDASLIFGSILIIAGIALVNAWIKLPARKQDMTLVKEAD